MKFSTPADNIQLLQNRLREYEVDSPEVTRNRLIAAWKTAHPEAAKETSSWLHPLMLLNDNREGKQAGKLHPTVPDQIWGNDIYNVTFRQFRNDPVFGTHGGMIQIGISSLDGTARHDWRDFQAIKNQLAGEDTEGFELYPAESRLLDPSNYYTLWCFPGLRHLRIGVMDRRVWDADVALAPQRAFPKEEGEPI